MHVILTPVGSAGDVNPFIVVGRELSRRGHRVTLLATDVFAGVATNAGLGFASVGSAEEFERITNNPDLWDPRRGLTIVLDTLAAQMRRCYAAIEQLYEPGRTMLVGHSLSFFTRVFEESHPVPSATMHLSPSVFRSDFQQPALPTGTDITGWPRWAKRMLWWGVDRFAADPRITPPLNRWRAELGLPPISRVFRSWIHSPQRVLGMFPGWFGEPQPDWPPQLRLAGFVLSDEHCAPSHRANAADVDLEQFLARGDPPIVFTPGSANQHAARFFREAIGATARLRRRALLVTSYQDHLPRPLPAHAFHASYASFAALFPRAAAVVHHGGIGTCAQALAAGVPQLVMPMGFDQPDNAARIVRLGVGDAIGPAKFTATRVADALEHLTSAEGVAAACRRCRERIGGTNAVGKACDLLEEHFHEVARPTS